MFYSDKKRKQFVFFENENSLCSGIITLAACTRSVFLFYRVIETLVFTNQRAYFFLRAVFQ